MAKLSRVLLCFGLAAALGCGDDDGDVDAGFDSGRRDAGPRDSGPDEEDAGPPDAGEMVIDTMGYDVRLDPADAYVRVDRLGVPMVSPLLVTDTNGYNDFDPSGDTTLSYVPEMLENLVMLHGSIGDDLTAAGFTTCDPNPPASGGLPPCARQELATGFGVNVLVVPDTLKLTAAGAPGFPLNGRELDDPAADLFLGAIMLDLTVHEVGDLAARPLNPTANDVPFLTEFPYMAEPHVP